MGLCLAVFAGCAHLETPREGVYPFQALFRASGRLAGNDVDLEGALVLLSASSGTVHVYGPMGLAAGSAGIEGGILVFRDMWGRTTGTVELPLSDAAGIVAGDVPGGVYLLKVPCGRYTKVLSTWGWVCVDEAVLPRKVHTFGEPGLDLDISVAPGAVGFDARLGGDRLEITVTPLEGGRWPGQ